MAIIFAGNYAPSEVYVRNKEKYAKKIGIKTNVIRLSEEITEEEYNSVDTSTDNTISPRGLISEAVETTYKRLATTMYSGTRLFTYETTLNWKLIL